MYQQLKARIAQGEALLLDGAIGTQLQRLGVPMDNTAWAATALATQADVVLKMHGQYLRSGADIITTNTFSSARHNLEPIGLGDKTIELNRRAVDLARQARQQFAPDKSIAIAGSVSHFGILVGGEPGLALHRHADPDSQTEFSQTQARRNIREQAECLVDAGVDLLLLESTGNMTQRQWLLEETSHLDIPRWLGYRCRLDDDDDTPRVGYGSATCFAEGLAILAQHRLDGVAIFHSLVADTTASLPVLQQHWGGIIAAYPEAGRTDYTASLRDDSETSGITPLELPEIFNTWIGAGVQVVGGCCGIDAEYYTDLKSQLRLTSREKQPIE
ncbi:MAG: homocysteine S-methyltransferase family protein [Gammaproteobacteria bacterium]|nr:homocysteine S-methyltransferase family protein [Gammaproteobacteria bacterium]